MSKIAKFISSALNNSSANEAAQALKMAASYMQKEGINPADFLSFKGGASANSAEVNKLKSEINTLHEALAEARKDIKAGVKSVELREAKETAIHWHNKAKQLESESVEYAQSAVEAQNRLNSHIAYTDKLIFRLKLCLVFAAVCGGVIGYYMTNDGNDTMPVTITVQAPSNPAPIPVDTGIATCRIGEKIKDNSGRLVTVKFWFKDGVVTSFANGKLYGKDKETNRSDFLNKVNSRFKDVECKLGVLN